MNHRDPVVRQTAQLSEPATSKPSADCSAYLEAFAEHQRTRGLGEVTIALSAGDLRLFYQAVAKDLASVTRQDVVQVLNRWRAEGLNDNTIRRRGSVLHSFYEFLFLRGLIKFRPTTNVPLPKVWVRVMRAPNLEDLERLIAAVGLENPCDLRDRAILLLLRDTGMRETALSHLCIEDIDWANRWITIRRDKFSKQHTVPASTRALEALHRYVDTGRPYFLRGRDLPYLFPGVRSQEQEGEHITRQRVWQIVTFWSKQVLGYAVSPHRWRAACLTEGAEKGMDVFDLMNLAGHESPEVTDRYIRHQLGHLKDKFYAAHPRAGRKPKQ